MVEKHMHGEKNSIWRIRNEIKGELWLNHARTDINKAREEFQQYSKKAMFGHNY